jgi:hypothetical protein
MIIQSVELVAMPNAIGFQNKLYHARLDNGEELDLFQHYGEVNLPPESLVGLTVEAAMRKRAVQMSVTTYGASRFLSLVPEYLA